MCKDCDELSKSVIIHNISVGLQHCLKIPINTALTQAMGSCAQKREPSSKPQIMRFFHQLKVIVKSNLLNILSSVKFIYFLHAIHAEKMYGMRFE